MKILIIRLSSIGDCVLASPVVEALRERYPDAHLTWVVQAKSVPVVQGLPGLDEVLLWDNNCRDHGLARALVSAWRGKYDVALDLHGLDKAAIFMLASRAKRRIAGTYGRHLSKFLSNESVDETELKHWRYQYLQRASLLDIAPDALDRYYPRVPVKEEHYQFASDFLLKSGVTPEHHLIGFNLGASVVENRWPVSRFAELASQLLLNDPRIRIITFGAPADQPLEKEFEAAMEGILDKNYNLYRSNIISGAGHLSLLQMAAVTQRCSAFVTADTGPMHIAAAMGAPVIALFGPANQFRSGPVHKPGCAPIRIIDAREITGTWPAPMTAISVESVLQAAQQMIYDVDLVNKGLNTRGLIV